MFFDCYDFLTVMTKNTKIKLGEKQSFPPELQNLIILDSHSFFKNFTKTI